MLEKVNPEVFLKVAETGSFRKAADDLGYTQAGISYIVSAMEEALGVTLFIREHNGVRLSPEGNILLPHIKQLYIQEHLLQQAAQEIQGLDKGLIRVQIFDSISIHWIPGIIHRFQQDYPGIQIELITEEDSVKAEEMVLSREVDCGFFLTSVHAKLDVFPLIEEKMLAIVSPEHELAGCEKFPVAKLAEYPYISMKYDDHTGINAIFHKHGVKPNSVFCMDNDYAAMAMVSNGLGYCIFPELLLQHVPYALKCLELDQPETRIISIGTASMQTCSAACRKFIEYTRLWVQNHSVHPSVQTAKGGNNHERDSFDRNW